MKNPVTTISGIILLILAALSTFQIITKDQEVLLLEYSGAIVEAIVGVIALFAKDSKKINL